MQKLSSVLLVGTVLLLPLFVSAQINDESFDSSFQLNMVMTDARKNLPDKDKKWTTRLLQIAYKKQEVDTRFGELGQTALMWAAANNKLVVADWLLKQGADPDYHAPRSSGVLSPMQYAIGNDWDEDSCFMQPDRYFKLEMIKLLLKNGASPNKALKAAVNNFRPRLCRKAYSADALDANDDQKRETADMRKMYERGLQVIDSLLEEGVSHRAQNEALLEIANSNTIGVLRHEKKDEQKFKYRQALYQKLLASKADVNATEKETGWTVLFTEQNPYLLKFLLDNGADVGIRDLDGRTALFYQQNNKKLLVKAGVNPNARDKQGFTAEEFWAESSNK